MIQLTRQQLYDKIKETSKDEYILSEMQRLGYWKEDAQPTLAASLIKRRGDLQRQINALSSQITDPQAALKAIHQERMAAARQQRIDTKVKREVERYQRAQAWHEKQQNHIHYLGDAAGFKPSAADEVSDAERLNSLGLPVYSNAAELAAGMGITLNELRFLTYSNQVSRVCHYQHFAMQKKSGGTRLISAPMPRLKRLQYWVLDNILQLLELTEQAHGFVTGRSIVSNAQPHLAQKVVINMDLKDFFPTVTYPRIKGTFAQLGYNNEVASLLALLCSEADTQTVEMDGQRYYLNSTSRRLPQGAPTSPALSNVICRTLDKRLQGLATKHGFAYTRYADDESATSLALRLGLDELTVKSALGIYSQYGRVLYDMDKDVYRIRELSKDPLPMDKLRFSNEREAKADNFRKAGLVTVVAREAQQDGRQLVRGEVIDNAHTYQPEITLDADMRLVEARCSCHFYIQNKLNQGPCEHMLAVRLETNGASS